MNSLVKLLILPQDHWLLFSKKTTQILLTIHDGVSNISDVVAGVVHRADRDFQHEVTEGENFRKFYSIQFLISIYLSDPIF